MLTFDFQNQTAIVTGGTRGLGRAISEKFLAAGARVIATYAGNDQAAELNSKLQTRRTPRAWIFANATPPTTRKSKRSLKRSKKTIPTVSRFW